MTTIGILLSRVAKAIVSGISAFVGATVTILSLQPVDHQGVQYISQLQWGIVILAVLAAYGVTWRVPNGTGRLPGEVAVDPTTLPAPSLPIEGAARKGA